MLGSSVKRSAVKRCLTWGRGRCFSSVYTWGTGNSGQLGQPSIEKSGLTQTYTELSPKIVPGLEGQDVCDISCGWKHTVVSTTDGRVLSFGSAKKTLLGHDAGKDQGGVCLQATHVSEGLEGVNVTSVAAGEHHTAALSDKGAVYTWGWGGSFFKGCGALGTGDTEDRPRPTQVMFGGSDEVKIKKIDVGRTHTVALGEEGEVWTWGHGENGRLGNGGNGDQLEPYPVDFFLDTDTKVVDIACGSSFTLALDEDGLIYGWGKNDQSQLGLGGGISMDMYAMEDMPRLIDALQDETIVAIGAGASQSLCINEKGEVFFWGNRLWMEPHKMTVLSSKNIVQVSCGNGFSAALSDAGQVYTWGKGLQTRNSGVMGHGDKSRRAQPELIESLAQTSTISKVSCGNRHAGAITGKPAIKKKA